MLILNAGEVRLALPMSMAITAMRQAFLALSHGRATVPPRIHLPVPRHDGVSLIMPSLVDAANSENQALAVKVVSLFEGNSSRGLPRIQSAVIVLDPATGRPVALLEGATLTAIRTAATSAVATDLLARRASRKLAIFGAGVLARTHIFAMCAVRPIEEVWISGRNVEHVATLISELNSMPEKSAQFHLAPTPRDALEHADIVCTVTNSNTPVFHDSEVPFGLHINAVGSYKPEVREIPGPTVGRAATIIVDNRDMAWSEAGDLIQARDEGLLTQSGIRADLGELISHPHLGRRNDHEITLFKSVGIAVQDAVAAQFALSNARTLGIGTEVKW